MEDVSGTIVLQGVELKVFVLHVIIPQPFGYCNTVFTFIQWLLIILASRLYLVPNWDTFLTELM